MLRCLLHLSLLLCCPIGVTAQQVLTTGIPVYQLPRQDNSKLIANEARHQEAGRPAEFAVSLPVDLQPETDGKWTITGNRATWQLQISSQGAKSLNLGFSEFVLPKGAELYLSADGTRYGPFTTADNEGHAEFWSPLLQGDRLLLELNLPAALRPDVRLRVATVNHDFTGVASIISGDCNVDVICGAADGFPEIDRFRDVIRSVAAFTINGRNQCTGFLVNNANQDGRPLFLTAKHCRLTTENAASLVVYWNYQNSTCRTPYTPASSAKGDGKKNVFNLGARLLASHETSDFALLELDEPVNPLANAYFAGWSAELSPPTDGVVTIHHPSVEEKRISISAEPTTLSNDDGIETGPEGNFIRVPFWNLGTTEGGSSGAPLFDLDGLARGHLFGGLASCSRDTIDIFGSINRDWTGGGTPSTRLSDWLDPCGSGMKTLGGLDQSELSFLVTARQACLTTCLTDTATFLIRVGEAFADDSPVEITAADGLVVSAPTAASGGESFSLTVINSALPTGTYDLSVTVGSGADASRLPLTLNLSGSLAAVPRPLEPTNETTAVDPFYLLRWAITDGVYAYDVELARSPDFANPVGVFYGLTDTLLQPDYALPGGTTYYWRVRGNNACGPGNWSTTAEFTTADLNCNQVIGTDLPLTISAKDSGSVIATIEVTQDLAIGSLSVDLGIEHDFLGDVSAVLISPAGTVVPLFDALDEGLCAASDIYATFTDAATLTAAEFNEICRDGRPDFPTTTRALGPLDTLTGESSRGTWQLVVTDHVPEDGGSIVDFKLRICAVGSEARDLSLSLASEAIISCSNTLSSARLLLGEDFSDSVNLSVRAGDQPLDNYTYTYDPISRLLDVTFSAWTLVGPGTFPLTFVAIEDEGSESRAVTTLTVLSTPAAAMPQAARFDDRRTYFRWQSAPDVDTYFLEVSETEDFTSIAYTLRTADTRASVANTLLPRNFYWRVITKNTCGSLTGPARDINADRSTGVNDLPPGVALSVYPNPTNSAVTVAFDTAPIGSWRVNVFDAAGRQVQQSAPIVGNQREVDLAAFPPGAYYLRIVGKSWGSTRKVMLLPH